MALVLSFGTALGTGALPFFGRTAYWLMEMGLGAAVTLLALRLVRTVPQQRVFLRAALVLGLTTPAITFLVWATTEPVRGHAPDMARLPQYLAGVVPMTGLNAFLQVMFDTRRRRETPKPVAPTPDADLPSGILAIEAQAHYVVFHTADGQHRRLMRFSDAVGRMVEPGMQTHRSWWVARSAVSHLATDRRTIALGNGVEVPVSRRQWPLVSRWVAA